MSLAVDDFISKRREEIAQYKKQFERLFYFLEEDELMFIPEGEKWSGIECIEHVNYVSEIYLPQLTAVCQLEQATQRDTLTLNFTQRKVRSALLPKSGQKSTLKIPAPKKIQPRRIQNPEWKMAPQKVMENFLSDTAQLERILNIIPQSKELSTQKVVTVLPPLKVSALTAVELLIGHMGRHLAQAERILHGGRVEKSAQEPNPDLIYPAREDQSTD